MSLFTHNFVRVDKDIQVCVFCRSRMYCIMTNEEIALTLDFKVLCSLCGFYLGILSKNWYEFLRGYRAREAIA